MEESATLTKNMLIVHQSAPYSVSDAQEALDLALAAAAFDQQVNVLFTGDACYQLIAEQSPELIDKKNLLKMLKAFPIYNIEQIYVDQQSLESRRLEKLEDGINVKIIDNDEVGLLYRDADAVIRF